MSENGVVRFAGNLDPSAQEFRPTYPPQAHHHQHNQYPFLSPPPPPPLPPFFTDVIYTPPPLTSSYHVSLPPTTSFIPPSIPPAACSPTRGLLLTAAPSDVSESLVRRDLEIFGDVRAVQMGRVSEGILTVHFYDLRAAHAALNAVREQHMQHQNRLRIYYSSILAPMQNHNPPNPPPAPGLIAGRPLWAQFTIPSTTAFPDGHNQGTLVIFNLNPNVSAHHLRDIFQVFGAIKELRETPMKRQQRFVEFYDVRDASRALTEMNGKEINGRTVMIEYSRPGGHSNKKFNHSHHFNLHTNNNFHHHHHITKPHPSPPPPPQFSMRHYRRTSPRQGTIRRRRNSPCSEESLEAAMTGLSLLPSSNDGRNEDRKIVARKNGNHNNGNNNAANGNCSSSGSSSSASAKQQQTTTKVKPWRGKHKNSDPRFLIKEDAIVEAGNDKDTRSTVMIKNIPNKYSQKLLLNMLDNHCIHCNEQIADAGDDQPLSSYDFVYLPIDFNNKCNVGYGFVNMTSPEATLRLYKSFHHQHWEVFNSRKICEVTYARVQGLEALKEHFKNSKFACENDEYLPVVFSPPRDGRHLPAPLPIVFSNTTLHLNHDSTDVDASDFTSSTTCASTSTTTLTLHSDDFDHDHTNGGDHIYLSSTIQEGDLNDDDDDDDDDDSSSSNGGGGVVSAEYDVISNSSIGCSSS